MFRWLRREKAPPSPAPIIGPVLPPPALDYRNQNPMELFKTLSLAVEYVYSAGVDGHFAEFGTAWGRTAEAIARAVRACELLYAGSDRMHGIPERRFMLFDSFEGFPKATHEADLASPHVSSGVWGQGVTKALSADELRAVVAQFLPNDRIDVTAGWFGPDMPIPAGAKFALVHVDCDLYQSTLPVLDKLFAGGHFADGCVLLFDDFHCNRASPKFGQRRAWAECVERYKPEFTEWRDYGALSKAFRIHR